MVTEINTFPPLSDAS